jgi:hypothetical protein
MPRDHPTLDDIILAIIISFSALQLSHYTPLVTTQRVPLQLEICNTPEELRALALDWFNGIYGKKFHKRKLLALGDPASMTLLQPMPLKSRFFFDAVLSSQAPKSSHDFRRYHHIYITLIT